MIISKFFSRIETLHKGLFLICILLIFIMYSIQSSSPSLLEPWVLSFYKPLFQGLIPIIVSLGLVTLVPNSFKTWLLKIASWYVPLAILVVASTDVYGDMYSYGRSASAFLLMSGLFIITTIFVIVIKIRQWRSR